MCGRYTLRGNQSQIAKAVGSYPLAAARGRAGQQDPRYNIAPTQDSLVLRKSFDDANTLQPVLMRWGLVPNWSKSLPTQSPLINARSETVAEKPSFRGAFQRRRCLVPADGWYEWKKLRGANLPHFFSLTDESIFFMAGIWESWTNEADETLESFTILTTHANSLLAKYHDRMPVILQGDRIAAWLDADTRTLGLEDRNHLFSPIEPAALTARPANPIVNNNRSEGPVCLEPPDTAPLPQLDLGF